MSRLRLRLPEAMPASWVAWFTMVTLVFALTVAFTAALIIEPLLLGLGLGLAGALVAIALVGGTMLFVARRRLRREAYSVLRTLKTPLRENFDDADHQMLYALLADQGEHVIDHKSGVLKNI